MKLSQKVRHHAFLRHSVCERVCLFIVCCCCSLSYRFSHYYSACAIGCQWWAFALPVANFDGLRPLLVASHCSLCSLANKLRSFVRSFWLSAFLCYTACFACCQWNTYTTISPTAAAAFSDEQPTGHVPSHRPTYTWNLWRQELRCCGRQV